MESLHAGVAHVDNDTGDVRWQYWTHDPGWEPPDLDEIPDGENVSSNQMCLSARSESSFRSRRRQPGVSRVSEAAKLVGSCDRRSQCMEVEITTIYSFPVDVVLDCDVGHHAGSIGSRGQFLSIIE